MKWIKNLVFKFDHFCLWLWVKWYVSAEEFRLKAEAWTYKMNDKLKDR